MVLMVFFSSRISPRTSTVIFFDRSPLATAVSPPRCSHLRRQVAGHRVDAPVNPSWVPATPSTLAWPRALPSVPTSRATRVTLAGKRIELVDHGVSVPSVEGFRPTRSR